MQLPELELPEHPQRLRETDGLREIWDPIRRQFLKLTPEEWVRQNLRAHLVRDKGYPEQLMQMERGLKLNGMQRRTDLCVYRQSRCVLLIECKSPSVRLDQKAFDQLSRYNLVIKAPWVLLSNGIHHIAAHIKETGPVFVKDIPHYNDLTQ
jgi:hypothetical protein